MSAIATHASPFSGQWYPGEAGALERLVDSSIDDSVNRTGATLLPDPVGFVVPHAGIAYSGTVAAAAYRHFLSRPPERVFLIGFPHHGCAPGVWIPDVEVYETPLGMTHVDLEAVRSMVEGGEFQRSPESRLCDHSVEIQLPFLARCAPGARLVPIYLSRTSPEMRRAAALRLAATVGSGDVVIASSDFTHYGRSFGFQPFPVNSSTQERLRALDATAIEGAASLDESIFLATLRESGATVCGREPIALLLDVLAVLEGTGEIFQEKLDYRTSGEITDDFSHSVSYAALGYFRHSSLALTEEEQGLLLTSARKTLEQYQQTRLEQSVPPARITPGLARRAGVFVSLHKGRALRGCVGRVTQDDSLARAVPDMTLAAATEDSRFRPVRPEETGIDIEISVLSPLKRVSSKDKILAGTHGVCVDTGGRRGLLLPQVASERGWNTGQFLEALAAKIGVRPEIFDAPETRLFRFRAQVFH